MSQYGQNSRANGGGPEQGRGRRTGYPGFGAGTQPGNAGLTQPPNPASIYPDTPPLTGRPLNPQSFGDVATAVALGVQEAMGSPHIRMLIQQMLDNAARATIKVTSLPFWQGGKTYRGQYGGGLVTMDVPSSTTSWTAMTQALPTPNTLQGTLSDGAAGVIREFGFGLLNPDDWASVCFRLTVNGAPQFPFNRMCCPIASMSSPKQISIVLQPGDTWALEVFNNKGSTVTGVQGWCLIETFPVENGGPAMNAHGYGVIP